jgi:hypothetical protein
LIAVPTAPDWSRNDDRRRRLAAAWPIRRGVLEAGHGRQNRDRRQ